MGTRGLVRLKAIFEMLKDCAPGYAHKEKEHRHWIMYGGKTFRGLPKGKHGSGSRAEIEIGHIKDMVKHLGISPKCANAHLPLLQLNEENPQCRP